MIGSIKMFVPTFVVDAPGGGGKISVQPNYIISQSAKKVVLRNFEGVITTYPEPESYTEGTADAYFEEVYPYMKEQKTTTGISSLMNDEQFNLVPEGLKRYNRRQTYESNPTHETLKNKREKRDELKEKKYEAERRKESECDKQEGSRG